MTYTFNTGVVFAMFLGIFLTIWSEIKIGIEVSGRIGLYLLFLFAGIVVYASILFICTVPAFTMIRIDYVRNIFLCIANIARKPVNVFPQMIQKILYLIPIAYIPSGCYLGKCSADFSFISIPAAAVLFIISRILWKEGTRHCVSVT